MQTLRRSWLGKLAGSLSTSEQAVNLADADLAFLNGLFEQYVDTGLALVRSKCHEVIATVDVNLVTSLTYLLQASLCLADFSVPCCCAWFRSYLLHCCREQALQRYLRVHTSALLINYIFRGHAPHDFSSLPLLLVTAAAQGRAHVTLWLCNAASTVDRL
jgi:hypothetical protein